MPGNKATNCKMVCYDDTTTLRSTFVLVSNSCSLSFRWSGFGSRVQVDTLWPIFFAFLARSSDEVNKKARWNLLMLTATSILYIYLRSMQRKSPMGINPYLRCWLIIGQNNITTAWMVEDFIRWKRKGNWDNCCKVINCAEHQVVQSVDQKVLRKIIWKVSM